MLVIGIKTLSWSAVQSTDDEEEKIIKQRNLQLAFPCIRFTILLSSRSPYFLSTITGVKEETRPVLFNFIDGIIKIAIFLIYLYGISFMKDVKRFVPVSWRRA
jgi:uncharacterized protein YqhQ